MGALEYEPASTIDDDLQSFPDLDSLAEECLNVLSADFSNDLDQLFVLGGSSGGARPKILTTINGEEWIIKFPSSVDAPDIGELEYHISNLAPHLRNRHAGNQVVPFTSMRRLFWRQAL